MDGSLEPLDLRLEDTDALSELGLGKIIEVLADLMNRRLLGLQAKYGTLVECSHGSLRGTLRCGDEAAAQHPRARVERLVKDASLARRDAALSFDELDLAGRQEQRRRGRPGRAHAGGDRKSGSWRIRQLSIADPVHLAKLDARSGERRARADDNSGARRIEGHHVERLGRGDAEAPALPDRVVNNAGVTAEEAAVEMDNVAGNRRAGDQALDHLAIVARWNEADVLAVGFFGVDEPIAAREFPHLRLRHPSERKTQPHELLPGGCKQKIALVAVRVSGAIDRPPAAPVVLRD